MRVKNLELREVLNAQVREKRMREDNDVHANKYFMMRVIEKSDEERQ